MQTNPSIFKAYDIRGVYPSDINEETAYAIARAYATLMKKRASEAGQESKRLKIAVGSDMRDSSPALKEKVIAGLLDSGIDVDDIGLVSTPTYYFTVAYYGYDGGMQVSASHNPKEYNGVKAVAKGGVAIGKANGLGEMLEMIEKDGLIPIAEIPGVLQTRTNVVEDEVKEQSKSLDISKIKPLKVVVDASNAMGAVDMEALFSVLPCELVKMNFNLDGSFPAHGNADPMPEENTKELSEKVVEEGADLGIAPDGDGDRYFFVDEKGHRLSQAVLRGLVAKIMLTDYPGAKIAYDIRPGKITKDMIEENGGVPILTPVGHTLIKDIMIKEGAVYGGESSGHHFFKLPYGTFESPFVLVLKMLKFISEQGKPLSEVIAPYNRYVYSGEINTHVKDAEEVKAKLELVKQKYSDGKMNLVDGVFVEYPDYWFLLRGSNTEPLIRLTVEAVDQKTMEEKRDELMRLLK